MTISDIIHSNTILSEDHMAFVVEQYIKVRKGVSITINYKRFGVLWSIHYADEIQLLSQAYEIAAHWFKEQGY